MMLTDLTWSRARGTGCGAASSQRGRADRGASRRDRGAQPAAQRLHHGDGRAGAGGRGGGRRGAGCGRGPAAAGRAARDQGPVLHRGRADHGGQPDPRAVRAAVREHGDREPAAGRRGVPRQDQHGRVRHGLVEHDVGVRAGGEPVDADRQPQAGAGRLVGRLGGGGGGAAVRWGRRARTPAARSGSRRRSPGSSASSRPMGAARAGAWWRSRPRSTSRGRSRAPWRIARSCWAAWPGSTRRTARRRTWRCRISRRRARRGVRGLRIGVPREYRSDDMPPEIEALWQQGPGLAARAGGRDGRRVAAAHEIWAGDLLHRGAGRGVVEPGAL